MISFDTETALLRKGDLAPKFICASTARVEAGANCVGRLIDNAKEALSFFRGALEQETIAFANAAYDLGVMAQLDPSLFPLIFRAIEEGRIFDVLIAEALHAIGKGHLGMEPCPRCQREAEARRQEIRSYLEHKERQAPNLIKLLEEATNSTPTKSKYDCEVCKDRKIVPLKTSAGKVTNRYSLDVVVKLNLGRTDAKAHDDWRLSYALLDGIPSHRWPETARVYPVDDAINTLQVAYRQLASHLNLGNMRQQVAAAFALHLGAAHGLRVDPSRVEALKKIVDDQHDKAVAYFQSMGWIRDTGSEDQIAIKTAVALAYGASKANPCKVCKGTGLSDDCNGEKEEEGWARCRGQDCKVCDGTGKLKKPATCKVITSPKGNIRKPGCDGTGLDISYLADLPRTSKKGIATDRDSLLEADDEALLKFAENEFEKSRTTYVPYLLTGSTRPLSYTPNVLVATGRCSYEGSPLHQMPRAGGERETIRARGAWCGYPIEMVLGSTDYEAGELCTLGQYAKWVTGGTAMVDAINAASPGVLHSDLAASILGLPLDEFLKRLKAKDKQAVDFRQMSKCFHPDTEVLTRRGWVKVSEVTLEDEVAAAIPVDPPRNPPRRGPDGRMLPAADGRDRDWWSKGRGEAKAQIRLEWQKPTDLTARHAPELLHLKNNGIDLRVTPDHRMLTFGNGGLTRVVEAKDFGKQRGWFNAVVSEGSLPAPDERLLRLAVAVQADGTYHGRRVKLGFSKERKIERLKSMLSPDEYEIAVYSNGKHQPTTFFILSQELSATLASMLDADKTLPWSWVELPLDSRLAILDEAKFWDSHSSEHTGKGRLTAYIYSSHIPKNLDVLQAIATVSGRKTHVYGRNMTVRLNGHSRGENVETTTLQHNDTVYCLSVPSSFIVVRDGGIPVVVGQCINFGSPGGMGAVKLVLSTRKKNTGFTVAPGGPARNAKGEEGYWGVRYCILTGAAKRCGDPKITFHEKSKRKIPPVCEKCLKVVETILRPAYFARFPEIKEYFTWVAQRIEDGELAPCYVWDADKDQHVAVRWRATEEFPAYCNNGFQSMLSDIGKDAFYQATKECYTGLKPDGSPSPLFGSRMPIYLHDEPLSELRLDMAHLAGPRIAEIMIASGKKFAPDIKTWSAETAIAFRWNKGMEPTYEPDPSLPGGRRLVPWDKDKR